MNKPTLGALSFDVCQQMETIGRTVARIGAELHDLRDDELMIDCLLKRRDAAAGGDYLGAYAWDRVIHLIETAKDVDQPDGPPLSPEDGDAMIADVISQSYGPAGWGMQQVEDIRAILRRKKAFKRGT